MSVKVVTSGSDPISVSVQSTPTVSVSSPTVNPVKVEFITSSSALLPSGGIEGSILRKDSAASYDTDWTPYSFPAADGDDNQVLVTDGAGALTFDHVRSTRITIRNDEGATIPAGTPVYSRGEIGGSERILVGIADASDPAKMPAIGIAETTLNTTTAQDGYAIMSGVFNTNVSGFTGLSEGDILYVSNSGGGLSQTKPTGTYLIQNVGIVLKTNGTILQGFQVSCIGRTNDVPNIPEGYVWIGDASGVAQPTLLSSISSSQNFSNTNLTVTGDRTHNLATNDVDFVQSNGGTSVMYLDGNNARVGINTTTPGRALHVDGTGPLVRIGSVEIDDEGNFTSKALSSPSMAFKASDDTKITVQEASPGTITFDVLTGGTVGAETSTEVVRILGTTTAGQAYVGIGTDSPTTKLDVAGQIKAVSDTFPVLGFTRETSLTGGAFTGTSGIASAMLLKTETSGAMSDGFGGGIVFGLNSPTATGNNYVARMYARRDGSDSYGALQFFTGGGGNDASMIIRSSGKVGIGTTSPDRVLHASASAIVSTKLEGTNQGHLLELVNSNASPTYNGIRFDHGATSKMAVTHIADGTTKGYVQIGNTWDAGQEILVVDGRTSRVGIGTTSPGARLQVNGSTSDSSANAVVVRDSLSASLFSVRNDGRVDIPNGVLYTTEGISSSGPIESSDGTNTSLTSETARFNKFGLMANRSSMYITNENASGSMQFGIGGVHAAATKMYLSSDGKLAVGTTSPATPLHIYQNDALTGTPSGITIEQNGTGDAVLQFLLTAAKRWVVGIDNNNNDNFKISGTADLGTDNGLTITNSTYNVGIGTTSPSAKLDVVGLANINDGSNNVMISSGNTAMTGASNTTVGYQAGRNNTSGINNSFVGYQAGYSNTIGSDNSFVGLYAGFNNTSGDNNSFFGRNAGYHSTGSANVVIGYGAGFGSATSTYSNTVAVGYQALYDLTTGVYNTAVGHQSLTNITTAQGNTAVGYNAGFANILGTDNSFVGAYSGANSTGSSNTAIGYGSSYTNTTGSNNTVIGRNSLFHNTTGSNNTVIGRNAAFGASGASTFSNTVAVGYEALTALTTGAQNTAVGYQAGYSVETGTYNVFLGWRAGYNETGSNKLYIANSDTTTPLIYGDFSLGEITINGDLNVSGGNLKADAIEISGRAMTTPATGEYGSGSKLVTQFATGTVTAGKVYVANAGAWAEGDADAGSTSIGMIAVATDAASATEMLIEGTVKLSSNTGFSGASAGDVLYLSTTAGELTTTAPSAAGDYVRVCGYVVSASTNEVFFSPSRDWTAL